jgi:hypothetical protein
LVAIEDIYIRLDRFRIAFFGEVELLEEGNAAGVFFFV